MGGPCWVHRPVPGENRLEKLQLPLCTCNFHQSSFTHDGVAYHSVEQAFQALKFPPDSAPRRALQVAVPRPGESDKDYGLRVWGLGQDRSVPLRADWEQVKVAEMYLLCQSKYLSATVGARFRRELLEATTGPGGELLRIEGGYSTWRWQLYNGLVQTLLRNKLAAGVDLAKEPRVLAEVCVEKLMAELHACEQPKPEDSN